MRNTITKKFYSLHSKLLQEHQKLMQKAPEQHKPLLESMLKDLNHVKKVQDSHKGPHLAPNLDDLMMLNKNSYSMKYNELEPYEGKNFSLKSLIGALNRFNAFIDAPEQCI